MNRTTEMTKIIQKSQIFTWRINRNSKMTELTVMNYRINWNDRNYQIY